jgi:hydrogenase maturation protease
MKTLVLGIGNSLMGDDGVGIHAIEALQAENTNEDITFIDGGTLSFTLTDVIANAENLIVIDAAELGQRPGVVKVFENEDMDTFIRNGKCLSVHEVSLAEIMDMVTLTEDLPQLRALIGIQPEKLDWDQNLSASISEVMPYVYQQTRSLIDRWHT